jgi:hypothetical protein
MNLLTNEIKKALPKIYATESVALEDKIVLAKFFNPCGRGTWYAVEGEERDGDFIFFGCVDLFETEWGYFSLSELVELSLPRGLKIERDLSFETTAFKNINN